MFCLVCFFFGVTHLNLVHVLYVVLVLLDRVRHRVASAHLVAATLTNSSARKYGWPRKNQKNGATRNARYELSRRQQTKIECVQPNGNRLIRHKLYCTLNLSITRVHKELHSAGFFLMLSTKMRSAWTGAATILYIAIPKTNINREPQQQSHSRNTQRRRQRRHGAELRDRDSRHTMQDYTLHARSPRTSHTIKCGEGYIWTGWWVGTKAHSLRRTSRSVYIYIYTQSVPV